ncbi:MAG TPA: ATP-binding cassette domain-containing protein [Terriglobales bacterium]|nr:ATP-binding cassette domain-containing protein [Terriglobales bacterium]HXY52239.1 ATP-binding cassette domain-containing protein [Terriglobales bacterium]
MAEVMISVDSLTVEYEGKRVLDRVSLDIQRGEVMVLLGGSGAGKTTMLRHIIALAGAGGTRGPRLRQRGGRP